MEAEIVLRLLLMFTTAVAILLTAWIKRMNNRIEQSDKKNQAQIWCMVDGTPMPFDEALRGNHVKVELRYDTCESENPELWGRELDVN